MDKLYESLKKDFFVMAGPCAIESEEHVFSMAKQLKKMCKDLNVNFIFKVSFDKANRSSINSYRGPGINKGIDLLKKLKDTMGITLTSDIHEKEHAILFKDILDIIQIPAFLCRQTDLVLSAAKTGNIINIKKGQFISPNEIKNIITKINSAGNDKIIITERGTMFGYNNLVVDMRTLEIMKSLDALVAFDATHSVQSPGGTGDKSTGQRMFVEPLAKAAVAIGINGIFLEVHENPAKALSDGDNMLCLSDFKELISKLIKINKTVKENGT